VELEIKVNRSESEVLEAVLQFAARRGYHLSHPWHCDGPRIEHRDSGRAPDPRIDLALDRKQGKTIVQIGFRGQPGCTELAYELRVYLSHDSSYQCQCPPLCQKCGAPVTRIKARFCGRCGIELLSMPTAAAPAPDPMADGQSPAPAAEVGAVRREQDRLSPDDQGVAPGASAEADDRCSADLCP
jgi:hypothetical protein